MKQIKYSIEETAYMTLGHEGTSLTKNEREIATPSMEALKKALFLSTYSLDQREMLMSDLNLVLKYIIT